MTTLRQALLDARDQLVTLPYANPILEAELLLSAVIEQPRTHLRAWPERHLTVAQQTQFQQLMARRLTGTPLAYLLGHKEFWSLDLLVTPDVLIPRPETELLVELALVRNESIPPTLVDLGTGSGAIAAALARERPHWKIYATDIHAAALAIAQKNFAQLGVTVHSLLGAWYAALPASLRFNLIVSNPPYIAENDRHLMQGDLAQEPRLALVSGSDGLEALRQIIQNAPAYLHSGGELLLEHGYNQGTAVRDLLRCAGFIQVKTWRDLAGLERVSGGRI